eukprot:m.19780 g.19780  ORF g.19780 m.19780 type:complete len:355 (-) comp5171_c0_seq1:86-1150(-)
MMEVKTRRFGKEEYEDIKEKVSIKLRESEDINDFRIVKELPGKDSFGDLDVLVLPTAQESASLGRDKKYKKTLCDIIKELFEPGEIQRNGTVYSFNFCEFQIDFIRQGSAVQLEMGDFYFGYGDMGGLLGRMACAHGLKFGEAGLWCNLLLAGINESAKIDQTQPIGRVALCDNPRGVLDFLEMDYDRYLQGFETQDEIVEWIKTCKLFHREDFLGLNHRHRHRANTRPFYIKFLNSISIGMEDVGVAKGDATGEMRECIQAEAIAYFGQQGQVDRLLFKRGRQEAAKEKFTGAVFKELGLQHKDVGLAVRKFKERAGTHSKDLFEDWLLATPQETINAMVLEVAQECNEGLQS